MFKDSSEVLKFIKDEDVKFLDIRFTDLPGVQQHFNIPASTIGTTSAGVINSTLPARVGQLAVKLRF